MSTSNPYQKIGEFLDPLQTEKLINLLESGEKLRKALEDFSPRDRSTATGLFQEAEIYYVENSEILKFLYIVQGAQSHRIPITPVWTMPGYLAQSTEISSGVGELIRNANNSIVCATYNFESTSVLQESLKYVMDEKNVEVKVYVDGQVGKPDELAKSLPRAKVFRSINNAQGWHIKSHTKFIIFDHQMVHISSANFSFSAENLNVEMGLRVEDSELAAGIESQMKRLEGPVYEKVKNYESFNN